MCVHTHTHMYYIIYIYIFIYILIICPCMYINFFFFFPSFSALGFLSRLRATKQRLHAPPYHSQHHSQHHSQQHHLFSLPPPPPLPPVSLYYPLHLPLLGAISCGGQLFEHPEAIVGPDATQAHVYTTVAQPLVRKFIEGYDVDIISYGQTGSGKTFTMFGPPLSRQWHI